MNQNLLNASGAFIVVLILIPNIIYAFKNKHIQNKCTNKILNISEQIGRYGSMLLMIFNIGIAEVGFWSKSGLIIWMFAMPILILLYWICWFVYFKAQKNFLAMLLAVIPSVIFLLNGYLLGHWLLIIFGVIFSVSHITITYKNRVV